MAEMVGKTTTIVDKNIEGRPNPSETIRVEGVKKSKSAGNVGSSNINHA